MTPMAERVLSYLQTSIAERGGTGRRPGKILLEMDASGLEDYFGPDFDRYVYQAINDLVRADKVYLEENELMGTYVMLK